MSQCCRQFFEEEDCKVKLYWMRIVFVFFRFYDRREEETQNHCDKYV